MPARFGSPLAHLMGDAPSDKLNSNILPMACVLHSRYKSIKVNCRQGLRVPPFATCGQIDRIACAEA